MVLPDPWPSLEDNNLSSKCIKDNYIIFIQESHLSLMRAVI